MKSFKFWLLMGAVIIFALVRAVITFPVDYIRERAKSPKWIWSTMAKGVMALACIVLLLFLGLSTKESVETVSPDAFVNVTSPVFASRPLGRESGNLAEFPLTRKEKEMFKTVGMNPDTFTEWPTGYQFTSEGILFKKPGRFLADGSFSIEGISGIQVYFSPLGWVNFAQGEFIRSTPNWADVLAHKALGDDPFSKTTSFFDGVQNVHVFRLEDEKPSFESIEVDYHRPKRAMHSKYDAHVAYIRKYCKDAIIAQREEHIPASITLAQGIIESDAGRSPMVIRSHNHFGIKCHISEHGEPVYKNGKKVLSGRKDKNGNLQPLRKGEQIGHCYNADDDDAADMFLSFPSDKECFEWRAKWLKNSKHYRWIFNRYRNYKEFSQGLEDSGYATKHIWRNGKKIRMYADDLQSIIRRYNLDQFDHYPQVEIKWIIREGIFPA